MADDARGAILDRIRAALAAAPTGTSRAFEAASVPAIPRDYRWRDGHDRASLLDELSERLRDYGATVERVAWAALPAAVAGACVRQGIRRLVVPADVPAAWLPATVEVLRDGPPLSAEALDAADGVLTGCALAIAQTGTIVLDGGARQGRRALSLVPDTYLCVVYAEQVVGGVPEAIKCLAGSPTRPITLISGPSATGDIELSRVEGVHGPRSLHILLVAERG